MVRQIHANYVNKRTAAAHIDDMDGLVLFREIRKG